MWDKISTIWAKTFFLSFSKQKIAFRLNAMTLRFELVCNTYLISRNSVSDNNKMLLACENKKKKKKSEDELNLHFTKWKFMETNEWTNGNEQAACYNKSFSNAIVANRPKWLYHYETLYKTKDETHTVWMCDDEFQLCLFWLCFFFLLSKKVKLLMVDDLFYDLIIFIRCFVFIKTFSIFDFVFYGTRCVTW